MKRGVRCVETAQQGKIESFNTDSKEKQKVRLIKTEEEARKKADNILEIAEQETRGLRFGVERLLETRSVIT